MINLKWSDYLNPEKKIAINCQTEDEAKGLLEMLDNAGIRWSDGPSPSERLRWDYEQENTCYAISEFGLKYDSSLWFEKNGYTVYKYSDVRFVDDEPHAADTSDPKADALDAIAKAMHEITDNLQGDANIDVVTANAAAMKALADAFEVVSRA